MAQMSTPNPNSLPGIVTDQPEVFESEPITVDTSAFDNLDLNDQADNAISTIDIPMRDAFSFFAKNEEQIFRKFYVQNHGEYKIAPSKPEEETDYERYNRLVTEVNGLLSKFQDDRAVLSDLIASSSLPTKEITNNLEVLSKQLNALEEAVNEGALNPSTRGFNVSGKMLQKLKLESPEDHKDDSEMRPSMSFDTSKDIKIRALDRRLNMLETLLGHNKEHEENLLRTTKCESLTEVADTLSSWLSLFKPESVERLNREIGYVTHKLEKINSDQASEENKLDPQSKSKLTQLCNLVTSTDKYRTVVPVIIHRLNTMEELQQKAAKVVSTVEYLEQIQSQILESLQWNKDDLTKLNEMFSKNLEHIKAVSLDIDKRISAIRNQE